MQDRKSADDKGNPDTLKNRPVLSRRKSSANVQNTSSDSTTPSSTRKKDDQADTSDTDTSGRKKQDFSPPPQRRQVQASQKSSPTVATPPPQPPPPPSPLFVKQQTIQHKSKQKAATQRTHQQNQQLNLRHDQQPSTNMMSTYSHHPQESQSTGRHPSLQKISSTSTQEAHSPESSIASLATRTPSSLSSTQRSLSRSVLSESTTQDEPNESLRRGVEVNSPANCQLRNFAQATLVTPIDVIVKEYKKKVRNILPYDFQCQEQKKNKGKNRYSDIFCIDNTRVILREDDGQPRASGDYIHANYVSSDDLRKCYILTQGPKKNTVGEFWHMVWQVQCPIIVMLCENVENGRPKCSRYLPRRNSTVKVGELVIRTSGSLIHARGQLIETRVVITKESSAMKSLNVKHWKWVGWPDHKVPTDYQTVFRLLRECRHSDYGYPIVHCSAGVGRSGTLVALEVCLAVLRSGKPLDVKQCVEIVRRQRAQCVQTVSQYLFLHIALLEMAVANDFIDHKQMQAFRKAYDRICRNKIFSFRVQENRET